MRALRPLLVLFVLLVPLAAASPSAAAIGEWNSGYNVDVRLLATGMPDGPPESGLEILLAPGWKTYWRTPGEGGIPPTFDFSGSLNLGGVEIDYPVPRVANEAGSVSNVYENRVLLPMTVTQAVPGVSTVLNLKLRLGVCQTLCIPVDITASVILAPALVDPAVQSMIEVARARVPGPAVPGVREIVSVSRPETPDTRPEFLVRVRVPDPANAVLLAEGPRGWYPHPTFVSRTDGNEITYVVAYDRLESGAPIAGATLTFTIISGGAASEQDWVVE